MMKSVHSLVRLWSGGTSTPGPSSSSPPRPQNKVLNSLEREDPKKPQAVASVQKGDADDIALVIPHLKSPQAVETVQKGDADDIALVFREENDLPSTKANHAAVEIEVLDGGIDLGGIALTTVLKWFEDLDGNWTMYDMCERVIKPRTEGLKCSYLRFLLSQDPLLTMPGAHQKIASRADVFISYTWSTPLGVLKRCLKSYLRDGKADAFIWMDAFCVNQHSSTTFTPDTLMKVFGEAVKEIGSAAIVTAPWRKPTYPQRIWCVLEAAMISRYQLQHTLLLDPLDEESLIEAMLKDEITFTHLRDAFSAVDVEQAQAKVPEDRRAILAVVRDIGVAEVNAIVLKSLKRWFSAVADKAALRYSDSPLKLASIYNAHGNIMFAVGDLEDALRLRTLTLETYMRAPGGGDVKEIATAKNNIAEIYSHQGRIEEADALAREVFTLRTDCLGPSHLLTLSSEAWIAKLLVQRGNYEQAFLKAEDVIRKYQHRLQNLDDDGVDEGETKDRNDHRTLISDLIAALGISVECQEMLGNRDQALERAREALALSVRLNGEEHLDTAGSMNNVALLLFKVDKKDDGLQMMKRSLDVHVKFLGPTHASVATIQSNVAGMLYHLSKREEALQNHLVVLQLRQDIFNNKDHPSIATSLYWISAILEELDRQEEASVYGKRALEMMERVLGPDHPTTVKTRYVWGGGDGN